MGRSFLRGMLNSARGISDKDVSPQAQAARRISGFADLEGLEFLAKIDHGTDVGGEAKSEIRMAVRPDHRDYAKAMGQQTAPAGYAPPQPAYAPPAPAYAPPAPPAMQQGAFPIPAQQPAAGADPRPAWAR